LVEPVSETQTPSRRGSIRAWRAEAKSSVSAMSLSALLPIESARESSPRFRPSGKTSRPVEIGLAAPTSPAACSGESTKLSCGSLRSRLAVRTIRQMKR
jgi:hypothetical protein